MPALKLDNPAALDELLEGIAAAPPLPVSGLASDSRNVQHGGVFLACGGARSHGLDYADTVIAAGAAAIVYDRTTAGDRHFDADIPVIAVDRLADHIGKIANRFYGFPSQAVRVAGVTGTNGKTTVTWLLRHCLDALGHRCGYVGTLGAGLDSIAFSNGMTTPDAVDLHRRLATFRDDGAAYAAIEVSSHALTQDRVAGVNFDTVLFTNLSRDHLDYHGDMQRYGEAKARLFTQYPARQRIINLDSEFGAVLAARCGEDVVTVSTNFDRVANGRPFVFVRSVVSDRHGYRVRITSSWGDGEFALPMPGEFNIANAALVLAFLLVQGTPLDAALDSLATVEAPPGRMQRVPGRDLQPAVFVDYAHTPEALDVALRALRAHCTGRLWCVFGCGGDRDEGKRPEMGRIAERRSDRVVVTSDNPRSEPPGQIIEAILGGMTVAEGVAAIEDRAAAIGYALSNAAANDCVLIAGKGHEDYQLIGSERRDFSDYAVALAHLDAQPELKS